MRRRNLLRGLALGAVAAPATYFAAKAFAEEPGGEAAPTVGAAAVDYQIAVTEQTKNKIYIWKKSTAFTDANRTWSWSPGTGGWSNLSDVKARATDAHGWVALVAASGGKVGIVDVTGEKDAELNDLLWSATPGGNPHAIERISGNGSIVSASSDPGKLVLYAPTAISRPSTLGQVQTISFPGAHGVLWDPSTKLLWAIGNKELRRYQVTGTYRNTRLKKYGATKAISGLGHDLQPDYTNKSTLLFTDTHGTYSINTGTLAITKLSSETRVKALCRHSSGEYISVRGDNTEPRTWASNTVRLSATADRTRSGAQFYKARIWAYQYE